MLKITDKSFRYTPSFNTDLKKKFRKLEHDRNSAAAASTLAKGAMGDSVVPLLARRSQQKA